MQEVYSNKKGLLIDIISSTNKVASLIESARTR